EGRHGHGRARVRLAPALRDRPEARAAGPRAAVRPPRRRARARRVGPGPRPARDPGPELPRLVAPSGRRPRERRMSVGARDVVLRRIRDALGPAPAAPEVERAYRHAGEPVAFDAVERFCEVVADYDATVHRVRADDLEAALARVCRERGAARLVTPVGLPWRAD